MGKTTKAERKAIAELQQAIYATRRITTDESSGLPLGIRNDIVAARLLMQDAQNDIRDLARRR